MQPGAVSSSGRPFHVRIRVPVYPSRVCWRRGRAVEVAASQHQGVASDQAPRGDSFRYLELDLPPPVNSRVTKSMFVKSSTKVADCPPSRYPEIAVIGRSNVGKSSLINSLTGNDKLAKVSKEPGGHAG